MHVLPQLGGCSVHHQETRRGEKQHEGRTVTGSVSGLETSPSSLKDTQKPPVRHLAGAVSD